MPMRVRYERSVGTNNFDIVNDGLVIKPGTPARKRDRRRLLCGSIPGRSAKRFLPEVLRQRCIG
jgi:hypothetical protein